MVFNAQSTAKVIIRANQMLSIPKKPKSKSRSRSRQKGPTVVASLVLIASVIWRTKYIRWEKNRLHIFDDVRVNYIKKNKEGIGTGFEPGSLVRKVKHKPLRYEGFLTITDTFKRSKYVF